MITTFFGSFIALITSIFSIFGKALDIYKQKELIDQGKILKESEIIQENSELEKKQTEIIIQDRTKEEVIEKMKKGTF